MAIVEASMLSRRIGTASFKCSAINNYFLTRDEPWHKFAGWPQLSPMLIHLLYPEGLL